MDGVEDAAREAEVPEASAGEAWTRAGGGRWSATRWRRARARRAPPDDAGKPPLQLPLTGVESVSREASTAPLELRWPFARTQMPALRSARVAVTCSMIELPLARVTVEFPTLPKELLTTKLAFLTPVTWPTMKPETGLAAEALPAVTNTASRAREEAASPAELPS